MTQTLQGSVCSIEHCALSFDPLHEFWEQILVMGESSIFVRNLSKTKVRLDTTFRAKFDSLFSFLPQFVSFAFVHLCERGVLSHFNFDFSFSLSLALVNRLFIRSLLLNI